MFLGPSCNNLQFLNFSPFFIFILMSHFLFLQRANSKFMSLLGDGYIIQTYFEINNTFLKFSRKSFFHIFKFPGFSVSQNFKFPGFFISRNLKFPGFSVSWILDFPDSWISRNFNLLLVDFLVFWFPGIFNFPES